MIAVDTNVLVHAHRKDVDFHKPAEATVSSLASGAVPWAIPWPCVHEFLAVVTHPKIFRTPTPLTLACNQVDAWMEAPTVMLLSEDRDAHWAALRPMIIAGQINGHEFMTRVLPHFVSPTGVRSCSQPIGISAGFLRLVCVIHWCERHTDYGGNSRQRSQ